MFIGLFEEESMINKLISETDHIVDIAFILMEYLNHKNMSKKIEYPSSIMSNVHLKLCNYFGKQSERTNDLWRVNHIVSFIDFKQANPLEIYEKIS